MQLVINTYGSSLRRKGDRFVVKAGEREAAFSAQKVQSIVIATGAHLSSNVVQLASQHSVDIVFLDKQGDPTARIWQTRMGSTATIRRRQIEAAQSVSEEDNVGCASHTKADDHDGNQQQPRFRKLKQRTIIQHEAHALANALLGRHDIPRIVETETLWQEDE